MVREKWLKKIYNDELIINQRGGGDKTSQDTQIWALFELQWRGMSWGGSWGIKVNEQINNISWFYNPY
jgi:hypothetical protein